jgi:hypothetical protein
MPLPQSNSPDASPVIPPHVCQHHSFSARPEPVSASRASGLGFLAQPSNLAVSWLTVANPACRLRSWAATLHQLLVHDFDSLFLPLCGPHLTPLATWSLESSLFALHSSEAPQGIDLSHSLFICTNSIHVATCTYNTQPRVCPHHIVNHSSQRGATIHLSSDAPVLTNMLRRCSER